MRGHRGMKLCGADQGFVAAAGLDFALESIFGCRLGPHKRNLNTMGFIRCRGASKTGKFCSWQNRQHWEQGGHFAMRNAQLTMRNALRAEKDAHLSEIVALRAMRNGRTWERDGLRAELSGLRAMRDARTWERNGL